MAIEGQYVPVGSSDGAFGEVYDRGYQHYEGSRLGRGHAVHALTTYSMRRALGSKKSWTAKVVPALMYVAAGLMVVIPLGIRAFLDIASVVEYWDYFFSIFVVLGVFVATIAPEMLCNDRSENVLTLYFSRAITRMDYLIAKVVGTALLTLTITLVPMVVYWLGRQLLEDSPLSAMKDNAGDLWRVVVMSLVTAFYLGSVALMISSFTGRKSIAVAVIIVAFLVVSIFSLTLTEVVTDQDVLPFIAILNPLRLVGEFSYGLFGQSMEDTEFGKPLSVWAYAGAMLGTVVFCCGVMYWRYVPAD